MPSARGAPDSTQVRLHAAEIDELLDLVPARFYLGFDHWAVVESRSAGLDQSRVPTTSAIVARAASFDGAKAADVGHSSGGKGRPTQKRKGKRDRKVGRKQVGSSTAQTHAELRAKLQQKIEKLREDRVRKKEGKAGTKGEKKPRAVEDRVRKKEGNAGTKAEKNPTAVEDRDRKKEGNAGTKAEKKPRAVEAASADEPEPEIGRLDFQPPVSALPFEATVGRRGDKVKRLRAELRAAEQEAARQKRAQEEGRGLEVEQDVALKKALKRARGEKVHDDIRRLRKAQRHMEDKKVQGRQRLEERKQLLKKQQTAKQEKRKENLGKARTKKQKSRVGVEGRR